MATNMKRRPQASVGRIITGEHPHVGCVGEFPSISLVSVSLDHDLAEEASLAPILQLTFRKSEKTAQRGHFDVVRLTNGRFAVGEFSGSLGHSRIFVVNLISKICADASDEVVTPELVLRGHESGRIFRMTPFMSSNFGTLLASGGTDGTARLWDLQNKGQLLRTIRGGQAMPEYVRDVQKLEFGDCLAIGGYIPGDHSERVGITVYDVEKDCEKCVLPNHTLHDMTTFPSRPNLLLSAGVAPQSKVWDCRTCECVRTLDGEGSKMRAPVVLEDRNAVVVLVGESVRVWDLRNMRELPLFQTPTPALCFALCQVGWAPAPDEFPVLLAGGGVGPRLGVLVSWTLEADGLYRRMQDVQKGRVFGLSVVKEEQDASLFDRLEESERIAFLEFPRRVRIQLFRLEIFVFQSLLDD